MPKRIPAIEAWERALARETYGITEQESADLHETVAALLLCKELSMADEYAETYVHRDAVAALLEKEGERCAKIAEGRARSVEFFNDGIEIGFNDACEEIAAAIRETRHG